MPKGVKRERLMLIDGFTAVPEDLFEDLLTAAAAVKDRGQHRVVQCNSPSSSSQCGGIGSPSCRSGDCSGRQLLVRNSPECSPTFSL